jgi:hypothetical protein
MNTYYFEIDTHLLTVSSKVPTLQLEFTIHDSPKEKGVWGNSSAPFRLFFIK